VKERIMDDLKQKLSAPRPGRSDVSERIAARADGAVPAVRAALKQPRTTATAEPLKAALEREAAGHLRRARR
jgi:hypothetical protein